MICRTSAETLAITQEADGNWRVQDRTAMVLGRFASRELAHRFALAERRARPSVTIAFPTRSGTRLRGRLGLRTDEMETDHA